MRDCPVRARQRRPPPRAEVTAAVRVSLRDQSQSPVAVAFLAWPPTAFTTSPTFVKPSAPSVLIVLWIWPKHAASAGAALAVPATPKTARATMAPVARMRFIGLSPPDGGCVSPALHLFRAGAPFGCIDAES